MAENAYMENRVFLQRGEIALIRWCFALMPWFIPIEMLAERFIFGWQSWQWESLWLAWWSVYAPATLLYVVAGLIEHAYGYRLMKNWSVSDWLLLVVQVAAILVAIVSVFTSGEILPQYWQVQVAGFSIVGVVLLIVMVYRLCRDVMAWRRLAEDQADELGFREYIRQCSGPDEEASGGEEDEESEEVAEDEEEDVIGDGGVSRGEDEK